jgi:O-acetyl-ADP-ribose deacetylase (regulator of RNase III)
MALELYAIAEYKEVKIMLKKGNCLKEFPYYFTEEFSRPCVCNFTLYSNISSKLSLEEGLAGELITMEGNNIVQKLEERGTKRPKIGELIFVETQLSHWSSVLFVVLDKLDSPIEDDRSEFVEYIKYGLDLAERNNIESVVMPGHLVLFQTFDPETAADIHFEAVELFLHTRSTTSIKTIIFCINSQDHISSFLKSALEKFPKYSSWLFLRQI